MTALPVAQGRRLVSRGGVSRAQTLDDLQAMALRRLPRFSAEYVEGGADEEHALRGNRAAFDSYALPHRVLRDIRTVDLSTPLFGRDMALPFGIGPTGFNALLWPDGDRVLARAAADAGILFGQSTVSNATIPHIAAVPGLRHWFQLYCYGPDEVWQTLVDTARDQGCEALVVTVDTPVIGNRAWDRRNYGAPARLSLSARLDMLRHPGWLWRTILRPGMPRFPALEPFTPPGQRDLFGVAAWTVANMRLDLDWSMLARMRDRWPGKLIVKGVSHLEDLRQCIAVGADGVVLSNHGGRQLDRAPAPLHQIAPARALARSLGRPDFAILVDSGFRRGADVVMARALGADAVLMGRATLYGLAAGGPAGVARAIEILTAEIRRTLQLLGVTRITDLSPEVVERRGS